MTSVGFLQRIGGNATVDVLTCPARLQAQRPSSRIGAKGTITAFRCHAFFSYCGRARQPMIPMIEPVLLAPTPSLSDFGQMIDQIAAIADDLAFRGGAPGDSFLLSGYGHDDYRRFARAGRLLIALESGAPAAFAVICPPDCPADESDAGTGYIRQAFGAVPVIKQIATARGHERRGLSRLLYQFVARRYPALPLFAAIAEQPRNLGSERFHARLGFEPFARFAQHPDGRPRGIWRRPPADAHSAKPELHAP